MYGLIDTVNDVADRDGFSLHVEIVYDGDVRPTDFECYSEEQISAWKRDEWMYVGVVVTASRCGVELGSASLWGVEYGLADNEDYARQVVVADLVPEAIAEAQETIDRLIESMEVKA